MSSALEIWKNFFQSCDLPSSVCHKYAETFVKQRMQPSMLKELTKTELKELGIDALGDQLSILRYIKSFDGSMHEFRPVEKRKTFTDEYNDNRMETDETLLDFSSKTQKLPIRTREALTSLESRFLNLSRQNLKQSRVICKKPVMSEDISSSSTRTPTFGQMRSDTISLKTMVVDSNSPRKSIISQTTANTLNPKFQILLNNDEVEELAENIYNNNVFSNRIIKNNGNITTNNNKLRKNAAQRSIISRTQISKNPTSLQSLSMRRSIVSQKKPIHLRVQKLKKNNGILSRISVIKKQ